MKILIDGQAMQGDGKRRGIGRYSRELCLALSRVRPDWQLTVMGSSHLGELELPTSIPTITYNPPLPPQVVHSPSHAYLRLHLSNWFDQQHADAVLILSTYEGTGIPIDPRWIRCPVFSVGYDLIPLLFSQEYLLNSTYVWIYYARQTRQTLLTDGLLPISAMTKRDLEELTGYTGQAVNIRGAVGSDFKPHNPDLAKTEVTQVLRRTQRESLALQPYLLYVGGGDFRKNIRTLIQAFAGLPKKLQLQHPLFITGELLPAMKQPFLELIAGLQLQDSVHLLGYVSDSELISLYQQAACFVFPSMYEGLGLPLLEAMACGTDVMASNTSSLPEFAGPGATLVDPMDVWNWTKQLYVKLTQPANVTPEYRRAFAAEFRWEDSARLTAECIENVRTKLHLSSRIVWLGQLDEHSTETSLQPLFRLLDSKFAAQLVFLYPKPSGQLPEYITDRFPAIRSDEIERYRELNPLAGFIYHVTRDSDWATMAGVIAHWPGMLIIDPKLLNRDALIHWQNDQTRSICIQQAIQVWLTEPVDELNYPVGPHNMELAVQEMITVRAERDANWREAVLNAVAQLSPEQQTHLPSWKS